MRRWILTACVLAALGTASYYFQASQEVSKKTNPHAPPSEGHSSSLPKSQVTPKLLEANQKRSDRIESLKHMNNEAAIKRRALIENFKELRSSSSALQAQEQAVNASKHRYLELMKSWKLDPQTMDQVFEVVRERARKENQAFDESLARGETADSHQKWAAKMAQAAKQAGEKLVPLLGSERAEEFLFAEEHILGFHHTPLTKAAAQAEVNRQLNAKE